MYVGCDLASSVSRRKSAHSGADPVCGGPIGKLDAIFFFFFSMDIISPDLDSFRAAAVGVGV